MKKLTFLLVGVLFVGSVFASGLQQAQALTTDELTSQIQIIQRQIDALRTQLGSINPTSAPTPIPGPIPTPTPIPPLLPGPIPAPPGGGGGGAPAPISRPTPVPPLSLFPVFLQPQSLIRGVVSSPKISDSERLVQ